MASVITRKSERTIRSLSSQTRFSGFFTPIEIANTKENPIRVFIFIKVSFTYLLVIRNPLH